MSIISYQHPKLLPDVCVSLSDTNKYSLQVKAMLTALGDYWTDYYRNTEPIAMAATGSVAALSNEYTRILDLVRCANIFDIPISDSALYDLIVIDSEDYIPVYASDGVTVDYYSVPVKNLADTAYLMTSLFEAPVVLERGVHFDVVPGEGYRFYVDIFHDKAIVDYAYTVEGAEDSTGKKLLLWASDIAFNSTIIYNRYGCFLYKKAYDGEQYKWMVSALMKFYENAKSNKGIQDVLNILYGVPYTRYKDERIVKIEYVDKDLKPISSLTEEPYIRIETDKSVYYTYSFADLTHGVGDVVPQFSLLATFNKVEDYIDHPGWWVDTAFPFNLVEGGEELSPDQQNELMENVLKYNTVHIQFGVSFDTYATYKQQIMQFMEIIEGGFPVYLYPMVDTIFRMVLIDKVDIEDEMDKLRLEMQMASVYDWGNYLKFDGTVNYYCGADFTHGRDAIDKDRLFDGGYGYDNVPSHSADADNCLHFDGSNVYTSTCKYNHDNDREELKVTHVSTRMEDAYPWDTSPHLTEYTANKYNSLVEHSGDQHFGYGDAKLDNESLEMVVRFADFEDKVKIMSDPEIFFAPVNAADDIETASEIFDGTHGYSGYMPPMNNGVQEDFVLNIIHR